MNPRTCTIQGDLSRADVVELVRLCAGKRVVEVGMGGSTLILARCADDLVSYETDQAWYDLTARRIRQIPDKTCEPALHMVKVPLAIPECDVCFVDGIFEQRAGWIKVSAGMAGVTVVHDSRAVGTAEMLAVAFADPDTWLRVGSVENHVGESNLTLIAWREPAERVDWNVVEAADHRAPVDADYCPDSSEELMAI